MKSTKHTNVNTETSFRIKTFPIKQTTLLFHKQRFDNSYVFVIGYICLGKVKKCHRIV